MKSHWNRYGTDRELPSNEKNYISALRLPPNLPGQQPWNHLSFSLSHWETSSANPALFQIYLESGQLSVLTPLTPVLSQAASLLASVSGLALLESPFHKAGE